MISKYPGLLGIGVVAGLTVHLAISTFAAPAAAQFYGPTEAWMNNSFPTAGAAVPLIFNALRAFFVVFLGVSLVRVVNAVRDGDELVSVARTPVVIVVVVTIGDFLAQLIHG